MLPVSFPQFYTSINIGHVTDKIDSVYAFVGHFALDHENPLNTPKAGSALVTFSCLAIAAFAISWGPLVWAVNAELYPARYRSLCMGIATASNWFWNFLISFL